MGKRIEKIDIIKENIPGHGTEIPDLKVTVKDFNAGVGIELNAVNGIIYNKVTQSGAINLTIAANSKIGAGAEWPVLIDGSGVNITGATIDPKSDTASTTSGDTDRYVFWKDTLGVYYSITNMGVV